MPTPAPTVLIVDDDADLRFLMSELLVEAGYSVSLARNGADAIDALERDAPPAAVLTDLLMPGVVGMSVLDYLRASTRLADVPVAVISGSPELAPPDTRVFVKPVVFGEVLEFVRSVTRLA